MLTTAFRHVVTSSMAHQYTLPLPEPVLSTPVASCDHLGTLPIPAHRSSIPSRSTCLPSASSGSALQRPLPVKLYDISSPLPAQHHAYMAGEVVTPEPSYSDSVAQWPLEVPRLGYGLIDAPVEYPSIASGSRGPVA